MLKSLVIFLFMSSFLVNSLVFAKSQLVEITEKNYNVVFDIKYATNDNFDKTAVYKQPLVFLHKDAAKKLKIASKIANKLGYKIKIYDGFRPIEVQRFFFKNFNDERYVTDPDKGLATHTRGIAIDCSLVDLETKEELNFGTPFDDFSEKSHIDFLDLSPEVHKNRAILSGIMARAGFALFATEWWHFQLIDVTNNVEIAKYPKLTEKNAGINMMSDFLKP